MASGAAAGSSQDNIVHYTSVRMRIKGVGQLDMTMFSQDEIYSSDLVPFTMQAATNIRPTRLMNFQHQRAYLRGSTNVMGEFFKINKIVIYAKEVFLDYPSTG
jgi:hypothetical protein